MCEFNFNGLPFHLKKNYLCQNKKRKLYKMIIGELVLSFLFKFP